MKYKIGERVQVKLRHIGEPELDGWYSGIVKDLGSYDDLVCVHLYDKDDSTWYDPSIVRRDRAEKLGLL